MNFKIATVSDAEIISLLGRVTYTESHGHFIEDQKDLLAYCSDAFSVNKIRNDLQNKSNLFYIVYVDELPVGYSKIVLNTSFEKKIFNHDCRLERIYILNHFISLKIGQPFLNFIIKEVKKNNATSIWLSVYIKNDRAISFYIKNDFKKIGNLNFLVNQKVYDNFVLSKKI